MKKQLTFLLIPFSLALSGTKAAQAAVFTTLAEGLDNPVGLNFGPDGALYVGESGIGGDGKCQPSPSTQFELICAGETGALTKVTLDGQQETVLDGLDSLALNISKEQGAGPQQVAFSDDGTAYLITGYAGNPGNRDLELNALGQDVDYPPEQQMVAPLGTPEDVLETDQLGFLYEVDFETAELTPIADLSKEELLTNPDDGDYISNPFKFLIDDETAYVADGGANVVWDVDLASGEITPITFPPETIENPEFPGPGLGSDAENGPDMPPAGQPGVDAIEGVPGPQEAAPDGPPPSMVPASIETQAVITGITQGPDGTLYAVEYSGFPFQEGAARVFQIGEDGVPEIITDGFTQIVDVEADEEGNLLILQLAEQAQWKYNDGMSIVDLPSTLVELAPDGTVTTLLDEGEGLLSATDLVLGSEGEIYVTNRGIGPGLGEVVRVDFEEPIEAEALGEAGTIPVEPEEASEAQSVPEPASILGLIAFGLGAGTLLKGKRKFTQEEA